MLFVTQALQTRFTRVFSANDTKGSEYGYQMFYHRRKSKQGPVAPEVSVLTNKVNRDSISYWNKIADIALNFRFRIVALLQNNLKLDFAAISGIRLVRCNSADRGNPCR